MADIAIINKVDTAPAGNIELVRKNIERHAPGAKILLAESPVLVSDPGRIRGKRVLVVEDGPTLTHGGMAYGAGYIAVSQFGAARIVDPREYAVGTIEEVYAMYPHIGPVLPAMGYSPGQIEDLADTINRAECDLVVFATPIHLTRVLAINKPVLRVRYEYRDHGLPTLEECLMQRLEELTDPRGPDGRMRI